MAWHAYHQDAKNTWMRYLLSWSQKVTLRPERVAFGYFPSSYLKINTFADCHFSDKREYECQDKNKNRLPPCCLLIVIISNFVTFIKTNTFKTLRINWVKYEKQERHYPITIQAIKNLFSKVSKNGILNSSIARDKARKKLND